MRWHWATVFGSMPDFRAELVRSASVGDVVWSEWRWVGTLRDGRRRDMRGVIIFGVGGDRIAWGRLYMEPVEPDGDDIDASLSDLRQAR